MAERNRRASVSTHTELAHDRQRCTACGRVLSSADDAGESSRCPDCRGSH